MLIAPSLAGPYERRMVAPSGIQNCTQVVHAFA